MPLTVADIEQKEFRTKFKGYDPEEVDRYLDDICDQMYALYQHIDMLQQRLAQANAAPAYAPARAAAVPPPAAAVVDYADQAQNELNQARQKARGIIEEAQQDARDIRQQVEGLLDNARQEAQDIRDEAQAMMDEAQAMMDEAVHMRDGADQEPVELHTPAMTAVNADEVEAMEARKAALEEEIEMLRATARDYRSRFQRLVEDQQHVLNAETELFD
ncbi:MAG: DivIVA domain-containing protein [Clostridia bacterium]|nr:DivIVA domain-containing protein [Clostridia bacterium]